MHSCIAPSYPHTRPRRLNAPMQLNAMARGDRITPTDHGCLTPVAWILEDPQNALLGRQGGLCIVTTPPECCHTHNPSRYATRQVTFPLVTIKSSSFLFPAHFAQ